MNKLSKTILWIIAIIIVIALIWLGYQKEDDIVEGEVIKIGYILPQTGPSSILGMDAVIAAQIAVDDINDEGGINGKRVKLIIEDDQYNTKKSLDSYEKLVNIDNVRIILMQTYGSVFALSERAKNDEVVIIDTLDCNSELSELGDHIFCAGVESESIAEQLSLYANQENIKKIGIIYFNSDTFMPYVKNELVKRFNGESFEESYIAGTTDFKTMLLKMKEREVEALVLLGYDETGNAMRQARELRIDIPFLGPGTLTSPSLQEASKGTAEGSILTFWKSLNKDEEPTKTFLEKFKAIKDREPIVDLFTYPTFDAVNALIFALNLDDRIEGVKNSLYKVNFKGITGNVKFNKDGSMRIPFSLFKLVNGIPERL